MNETKLEILDVTLRDGEQTQGVVFSGQEKLNIAKFLLLNANVDRVEIASARVSKGEKETVRTIMNWAEKEGLSDRIEILGFVDKTASVDWMTDSGAKTLNLLTKGSEKHLVAQLKKTAEEHLSEIKDTIDYALSKGITVNVYMEDWSNGFLHSPEYVAKMAKAISLFPIHRLFLPDTLGVLSPDETFAAVRFMK